MSAIPISNAVTAEAGISADATQAASSGAQIAASIATSNPVGIAIGSIGAATALMGLIKNIQTLQNSGSITVAQVDQIFTTLNMQTATIDAEWQKLTGSSAV